MGDVTAIRSKVQRILVDWLGRIEMVGAQTFSFPYQSTRGFIDVFQQEGSERIIVRIWAFVTNKTPASPALYEYLATNADSYVFGHLGCHKRDDGSLDVVFRHSLLGDFLDPEELKLAVGAVVGTADSLDDEVKERFGGTRFADQ
jgi:hypothetical protein